MKKADMPSSITITGNHNKVYLGGTSSHLPAVVIGAVVVLISVAILAISHCCPDLLADFVRWIVGIAINS